MTENTNPAGYVPNMSRSQSENVKDIKEIEGLLLKKFNEIENIFERVNGQVQETGGIANEVKGEVVKLKEDYDALFERMQELEQKGIHINEEVADFNIGEAFIKSDQFKQLQLNNTKSARFGVDRSLLTKTAIINATGQNQPLVPADRLQGIYTVPNRLLRVRDVLPSTQTSSNLIEYTRESTFTNNAGPQVSGSPEAFENVTKPESAITFTLVNTPVTTLAHFVPVSRQIMDDAPGLMSFINGRLTYGLKLKEETQILVGTGANGQLPGLYTNATAYTVQSPQLTNEIDIIRDMIKQAHVGEYFPDTIIMNPVDWYDVDVRKVGSSDDRYVVGNPREMGVPRLWGLPIVITNSLTATYCLLGSFAMGAEIKDRMQSRVEISFEDSTNFQKNMATVLCEERIALCIYRTEAFIKGTI